MSSEVVATVVSFAPGRLRLRVAKPHRTEEMMAQVQGFLTTMDGVTSVDARLSTGSLLVVYDTKALQVDDILRSGQELGLVAPSNGSTGAKTTGAVATTVVDRARIGRSLALLAAATVGGLVAPGLGLSARLGSFSAIAVVLALGKLGRIARMQDENAELTLHRGEG
jgi:copper chaperone CopZ